MESPNRKADIAAIPVRLTLLVLSVIGWVVLLAGVGMASKAIVNASKEKDLQFTKSVKLVITSPFLLCLVSAVPLYLLNLIHIIVQYKNKNWGHVVHSLMMSYRLPFIAGASASIFVGLGYIAVVKTDAIPLDYSELVDVGIVKILTGGAVIAVVCQWIESFTWPLFNYQRHPHRAEYRELEESTNFR